jgi:Cu/Ag efflux protein CusF
VLVLLLASGRLLAQSHAASGMLIKADPIKRTVVVSCENIPGYMDAMVMSFTVREATALQKLKPGMTLDFTMVQQGETTYADNLRARPFQSLELDPTQAKRLKSLEQALAPSSAALQVGQTVPDFSLVDQDEHRVSLAQFAGKVVGISLVCKSDSTSRWDATWCC